MWEEILSGIVKTEALRIMFENKTAANLKTYYDTILWQKREDNEWSSRHSGVGPVVLEGDEALLVRTSHCCTINSGSGGRHVFF